MKSKRLMFITFPVIVLIGVYFLGPAPKRPVYSTAMPTAPAGAAELEAFVAQGEAAHKLKPGNEAEIVWNDSTHTKTPYAVVYLHGFSASKMEGDPVHRRFAKTFGCNLYLSRLADHGIDTTEALYYFSADRLWESAKRALAIGKQLGNRVIIMSTSTGGTLALRLAAEYPDDVYALINMSPNIAINNGAAFILNNPWGLQIARKVSGGNNRVTDADEESAKYWNKSYRVEAMVQLEELVETSATRDIFERVKQPSLTLYYYKNEQEQDQTVKVSAILEMHKALGTPADMKEAIAMPNAGSHVLGCPLASKDVEGVYAATERFAKEKLKLGQ